MNAEDKDPFFLEVRDFYWNYLQEYAKREDASIGYINEGIRLLKTIDFAYRNLELRRQAIQDGEPKKAKNEFWDFSPGSPLGEYAEHLKHRLKASEGSKNATEGALKRIESNFVDIIRMWEQDTPTSSKFGQHS